MMMLDFVQQIQSVYGTYLAANDPLLLVLILQCSLCVLQLILGRLRAILTADKIETCQHDTKMNRLVSKKLTLSAAMARLSV